MPSSKQCENRSDDMTVTFRIAMTPLYPTNSIGFPATCSFRFFHWTFLPALFTGRGIQRNILRSVHLLHFTVEIDDNGSDQSDHDDVVYAENDGDDPPDGVVAARSPKPMVVTTAKQYHRPSQKVVKASSEYFRT